MVGTLAFEIFVSQNCNEMKILNSYIADDLIFCADHSLPEEVELSLLNLEALQDQPDSTQQHFLNWAQYVIEFVADFFQDNRINGGMTKIGLIEAKNNWEVYGQIKQLFPIFNSRLRTDWDDRCNEWKLEKLKRFVSCGEKLEKNLTESMERVDPEVAAERVRKILATLTVSCLEIPCMQVDRTFELYQKYDSGFPGSGGWDGEAGYHYMGTLNDEIKIEHRFDGQIKIRIQKQNCTFLIPAGLWSLTVVEQKVPKSTWSSLFWKPSKQANVKAEDKQIPIIKLDQLYEGGELKINAKVEIFEKASFLHDMHKVTRYTTSMDPRIKIDVSPWNSGSTKEYTFYDIPTGKCVNIVLT